MSENIGAVRTLKRKNVKGLALAAPAPRAVAPSESDLQIPGGVGSESTRQTAQLEIGIEYKLDLKREDLEVLRDLGHGNGGTVSKVRHMATGTIMARKVELPQCAASFLYRRSHIPIGHPRRGQEGDAPSDCSGTPDHVRLQFGIHRQFLRRFLE
jgi:hypothetical protein